MSRDSGFKIKKLTKFAKPHKILMKIDRSLKSSVWVCYEVVLLCFVNGQIRLRDFGQKLKKFTKPYKIQTNIDKNFKPSE